MEGIMMKAIKRILAPVDGSTPAKAALEAAVDLAEHHGADLVILNVIDDFGAYTDASDYTKLSDILYDKNRVKLEEDEAYVKSLGFDRAEIELLRGEAKDEIVSYAEAHAIDLIVVGSTGKGSIRRALLGSVSSYIVRHAHCDVLVVR
ncbi:universal stress protein [Aerococcus sanguinicola]|uniref:Universal stress protein n=2 Tax=Aerococcaceae TaxID=186827 RepID=A0A5N1GFT7_9LACT|nr:universal stress protein [Aerococcus sanguinicola]